MKTFLGSNFFALCSAVISITYTMYILFMIPFRAFLEGALIFLAQKLPDEGIEIDEMLGTLIWIVGKDNSRRLALMKPPKPTVPPEILPKGTLLLSMAPRESTLFFQAVVLLTARTNEGYEGVIVSKSTQIPGQNCTSFSIEYGGPIASDCLLILHTNKDISNCQLISSGVYTSEEQVTNSHTDYAFQKSLIKSSTGSKKTKKNSHLIFRGLCRWVEGQLEDEIDRGEWYPIDNNGDLANLLFSKSREQLWSHLNADFMGC